MVVMNQDWIEQDRARLRDIDTTLAQAEFLELSDEEVATLENEANELEGGLSDWATYQADLAHMGEHEPDYFYNGP